MIGKIRSTKDAVPAPVWVNLIPPIRMMTRSVIVLGTDFGSAPSRAKEQLDRHADRGTIILLFYVRQQTGEHRSGNGGRSIRVINGELAVGRVIIHQSQAQLLQVVAALDPLG